MSARGPRRGPRHEWIPLADLADGSEICGVCKIVRRKHGPASTLQTITFPSGKVRECCSRGPMFPPVCEVRL